MTKNELFVNIRKIQFTLKNFKKTAYHHYGNNPLSYLKLLYYSGLKMNTFIVYVNDLTQEIPPDNLGSELEVMKPSLDELSILRNGKDFPREFHSDMLLQATKCYVLLDNGNMAYIHWVLFKENYSRFLVLNEDDAELNYLTTLPAYRGRRLSTKMALYTSKDLKQLGYKRLYAVLHKENIAIITTLTDVGFKEVRRFKTIGPFSRKIKV